MATHESPPPRVMSRNKDIDVQTTSSTRTGGLVTLWEEETTSGIYNTWRDQLRVSMSADGTFVVFVRRSPVDGGFRTHAAYRSRRFKKVSRVLDEIRKALNAAMRAPYSDADVLRMLSRLPQLDVEVAGVVIRQFAAGLAGAATPRQDLVFD